MKRLISAGVLLIFVIAAYISGIRYINSTCAAARALISECETAYSSSSDAYTQAERFKRLWDEREGPLSFFVNHNSIDDIELKIGELLIYSRADEENDFFERTEALKTLLHQLEEDTRVTLHSIF